MSKANRTLLILLLIQVVIVMGMRLGGDDVQKIESVTVLEGFEPDKVTRLKIFGAPQEKKDGPPQEIVEMSKVGATWGIADADNYPIEKKKMDEFLGKLKSMRSRTTVLTKSTYHKKLEVSADKFQRKIVVTHDGKDQTIYLGTSPKFKSIHVRLDGQDRVLLVSDISTSEAGSRAWHWVDRNYVKFDKADVWSVKLQNKEGIIELERNPQDDTWLALGITKPLKTTALDEIVRKASTLSLDTPIGKTAKPEFGLDAPLATVTLVTGTSTIAGVPPPKTDAHTIKIGAKLEKENRFYVKSSTSDFIVKVPGYAVQTLVDKKQADLIEEEKKEEKK